MTSVASAVCTDSLHWAGSAGHTESPHANPGPERALCVFRFHSYVKNGGRSSRSRNNEEKETTRRKIHNMYRNDLPVIPDPCPPPFPVPSHRKVCPAPTGPHRPGRPRSYHIRPTRHPTRRTPRTIPHTHAMSFFLLVLVRWFSVRGRVDYFSFFLGRSCEECPHFLFRQLVARGGSRA